LSAFELFRIGPGPSSSSTVGPQRAALRFVHELAADGLVPSTTRVEVEVYGGLAFNGREHTADRAIVAGLCGQALDRCDATTFARGMARVDVDGGLLLGGRHPVQFVPARDLQFKVNRAVAFDGNAIRFIARDAAGESIGSRVYFSTGNGAILGEGDSAEGRQGPRIPYPFTSAEELLRVCLNQRKRIADIARANEYAFRSPAEVRSGLLRIAQAMRASLERGLTTNGTLPGGGIRRAPALAESMRGGTISPAQLCSVHAIAVAEENASGGRVVSAPSNGTAGPMAALLQAWRHESPIDADGGTLDFLLVGGMVGHLLRAAGVQQVGCQGEIGVASAMAAAGYTAVKNGSNAQILHAAERALEPHLGLACDPVGGRLQDPCIERNATAARRAYDAATAAIRTPEPHNGMDRLTRSIVESGRSMTERYKVASLGGVSVNVGEC
jgi:L-serine dehydratase